MNNKKNKILSLYRKFFYAIFLIFAIAIVYLLFPKQGIFKYEFQKGKPWGHETLISPFDFPILKPEDVLKAEKDSLLAGYIPYFTIDTSVVNSQITILRTDLTNAFQQHQPKISQEKQEAISTHIILLFESFYDRGILKNSIDTYESLTGKVSINKVLKNESSQVAIDEVLSLKSAYLLANDSLNEMAKADTVLLGIQKYLNVSDYLSANLTYDSSFNEIQMNELLESVSTTRGVVQVGIRIISEGDIVNNENYPILESLKQAYERNRSYEGWISAVIIGRILFIIALFAILILYLQNFNRKIFWKKRNFSLILTTVIATFGFAVFFQNNNYVNLYALPVCILPIIIRTFLGARMAIYIHLVTMLMIGFIAPNGFEFIFIQTIAGTIAVISLSKLHRRGHLIITAFLLVLVYSVLYFNFELIKEGNIKNIDWSALKWFATNGILLLIAYPLIYIFEKIFGFISDVTLLELSDTNHPLLRKLAETAPGTFQHSLQVANLAEAVIVRTGGNPMLVRTGALYHDVGKILSSQYFIENQEGGKNPHDELSYLKSAEKVISHVFDGVTLAKKHNIPDSIIDFIKMHHGKSMAKYFYLKQKELNKDDKVKEEDFMYPGPNPTSRETAVVMLADGVEAATRSLPEKNEESLKAIINQIIDSKVQNHELDDAPITFKDIKDIKTIFLEKLKNVYHLRIQYPKEIEEKK